MIQITIKLLGNKVYCKKNAIQISPNWLDLNSLELTWFHVDFVVDIIWCKMSNLLSFFFFPFCRDVHSQEGGGSTRSHKGHGDQRESGHSPPSTQRGPGPQWSPKSDWCVRHTYRQPYIKGIVHPKNFACIFENKWLNLCVPGEEWQVSKVGAYLPGAHEEVVDIVNAFILTDKVHSSVPFYIITTCFSSLVSPFTHKSTGNEGLGG